MRNLLFKTALLPSMAVFLLFSLLSGCSAFDTRPVHQMAYAEAAYQAALQAGSEGNPDAFSVFQLAKDQLARARSFYRLKNFREARRMALVSRRLSEEAEWRALKANSGSNDVQSLVK